MKVFSKRLQKLEESADTGVEETHLIISAVGQTAEEAQAAYFQDRPDPGPQDSIIIVSFVPANQNPLIRDDDEESQS